MGEPEQWLTVATVIRERGRRGEVIVDGCPAEWFRPGRTVSLFGPQGPLQQGPLRVEEAWEHQGRVVVKFSGIDSIPEAARIRGFAVRIPKSEREPPGEGEYWMDDLVGCRLVDSATGDDLGSIEGWQQTGGPILLVVRQNNGGELLVPFARSICVEVDLAASRILAQLPDGLKDLNRI